MTCLCHPVSQPPDFSNFLDVAKVFLIGTRAYVLAIGAAVYRRGVVLVVTRL